MKKRNKDKIRIITEILAMILFVFFLVQGRIQIWLLLFGGFVVLSLFFGRIYCGWICPIKTVLRPILWIKRKLRIKSFKTPDAFRNEWLRWVVLVGVVSSMLFMRATGVKINFILFILGAAVLLTLFFEENFWHRFLCPYGTILNLTSKISRFKLNIDRTKCISCGNCSRVCPSYAAQKETYGDKYTIEKNECLACFKCQNVCLVDAINYSSKKIKR
jgi:polyferredoxin